MTDGDWKAIVKIADKLQKHGRVVSEWITEIVVPYQTKLYLVQFETTMNDIIDGESVTVNMDEIVEVVTASYAASNASNSDDDECDEDE